MMDRPAGHAAGAATTDPRFEHALKVLDAVGPWLPGHWGSPYPSDHDVTRAKRAWPDPPDGLPGVDLNVEEQFSLLETVGAYCDDVALPLEPSPDWRFRYDNPWFSGADALVLCGMMRAVEPRRIIEVGSGFSSALMLDVSERFLGNRTGFTFIDPQPDRLHELLSADDLARAELIASQVQDVPPELFAMLEPGDILFIDSSHTVKMGGDVNDLVFRVLPMLRSGTRVIFHDVFYPFDYPPDWLEQRRIAWSEAYLLRAFLQYNTDFAITLFCDYLLRFHRARVEAACPDLAIGRPGSIWLRRVSRGEI